MDDKVIVWFQIIPISKTRNIGLLTLNITAIFALFSLCVGVCILFELHTSTESGLFSFLCSG